MGNNYFADCFYPDKVTERQGVLCVEGEAFDRPLTIVVTHRSRSLGVLLDELKMAEDAAAAVDYIVEPGRKELLGALVPKVVEVQLFTALLDAVAAEHAARVLAMQIATDNATELLKELKLTYNKARQTAITNEIIEIVSGAEALNG